jgi:hypothetical protein
MGIDRLPGPWPATEVPRSSLKLVVRLHMIEVASDVVRIRDANHEQWGF